MSDWYCSSAAYAAIAAFVPSGVYTLGQIVKPTAPALKNQWVFRCTTAGTASTEPAWTTGNNSTITTGGATFTNVTGQSAYGWSAAAGDMPTLTGGGSGATRWTTGDRIFVSSDHSETQTATTIYGGTGSAGSAVSNQILSVNRGGSVPPVAADLAAGASVTCSGNLSIDAAFPVYIYGITFIGTAAAATCIILSQGGNKTLFFDTCQLYVNTASATGRIENPNAPVSAVLYNTTLRFGATGQSVTASNLLDWLWLSTPSAIAGAIIPTSLFLSGSGNTPFLVTARGVDLSAVTGTLVNETGAAGSKFLFDSCRIAPGAVRFALNFGGSTRDMVELVNCYDGTNFISESWQPAGAVTTEFTITLSGGATDNVGTFSHKMVSNANVDPYVQPLAGLWMDANYATTGSAKTATVEIISSASLNNNDISLLLEYEGTAGSSVASIASSLPANVLTAASAVPSSSATWNSQPATPVRQHLQVTFTPRTAGRVRAQVRLGKASTTVWYNPQVAIT